MLSLFSDPIFLILLMISAAIAVLLWWLRRTREHRDAEEDDALERELYGSQYFDGHNAANGADLFSHDPLFDRIPDAFSEEHEPLQDPGLVEEVIGDRDFNLVETSPKVAKVKKKSPPPPKVPHKTHKDKPDKGTTVHLPELIIPLFVKALRKGSFAGADIVAAMEQLQLAYGEMQIFHHYGLDGKSGVANKQRTVFSIANMVEPGIFDLQRMDAFRTPGLILFMRLPGPLGGRVAFELMLNHAHRLAEVLKGSLEDERGESLTADNVARLRDKISRFEHGESP